MPNKILITGSSGYVGNFLAVYFGQKGIKVVGIDITAHPVVKNIPNFKFIECDTRNKNQVVNIFSQEQPSHVIHLAYLMDPIHNKKLEYEIDVLGSQNAINASDQSPSVRQFILFSSTSIYGAHKNNPEFFTEDAPKNPEDYTYAIYKKQIEEYFQAFPKRNDLKIVTLRMTTAVGPGYYKKGGVVSSFTKAPFALLLSGINTRVQFIHEDDVKVLAEKIVNDEVIEGVFNICPENYVTIKELAKEQNKPAIYFPLWLLRFGFWLLWNLRLANLTPAIAKLMAYSIIASGQKLAKRYNYVFQYTAKQAFFDAVEKRRAIGSL